MSITRCDKKKYRFLDGFVGFGSILCFRHISSEEISSHFRYTGLREHPQKKKRTFLSRICGVAEDPQRCSQLLVGLPEAGPVCRTTAQLAVAAENGPV